MDRDLGRRLRHVRISHPSRNIHTGQEHTIALSLRLQRHPRVLGEIHQHCLIIKRQIVLNGLQRQRAVHRPGLQVQEPEFPCQVRCQRALARARRPVNRNHRALANHPALRCCLTHALQLLLRLRPRPSLRPARSLTLSLAPHILRSHVAIPRSRLRLTPKRSLPARLPLTAKLLRSTELLLSKLLLSCEARLASPLCARPSFPTTPRLITPFPAERPLLASLSTALFASLVRFRRPRCKPLTITLAPRT